MYYLQSSEWAGGETGRGNAELAAATDGPVEQLLVTDSCADVSLKNAVVPRIGHAEGIWLVESKE
jgi:hypothetical protein